MDGERRMWRVATRAVVAAGGVAVFVFLSCGEPLGPVAIGWEKKATVPREYSAFQLEAVGPKGLYSIVTTEAGYQQLVTFDGSHFSVDYRTPSPDDRINGVSFRGDTGFMGVARRTYPEGYNGSLLLYKNGRWEEVFASPEYEAMSALTVDGGNSCLLLCTRKGESVVDIARYSNGRLEVKGGLEYDFAGYSPKTHMLYTYNRFATERREIFVSGDAGATWHREVCELPPHYELKRVVGTAASPDALYLIAWVVAADLEYFAIIRRTGQAGEGVYEFSYLGWLGPGVRETFGCAFRDVDHGMAVGLGTSMFYDAPEWLRETVDPLQSFYDLLADPRGGYWAISRRDLVWHP